MMADLLSSEAFWFWTMILVQSMLIVFFVEHGNLAGACFSLCALLAGLIFFPNQWSAIGLKGLTPGNSWSWFCSHIWVICAGVTLYLFAGLGWSMLRWWMFVRHMREVYEEHKAAWLRPRHLDQSATTLRTRAACSPVSGEQTRLQAWADHCSAAALCGGGTLTPELKPVWKDYVQNGYRH